MKLTQVLSKVESIHMINQAKKKSFSPSVNMKLDYMKNGSIHDIFGCGEYSKYANSTIPLLKLNDTCVHYNDPEIQEKLLENMWIRKKKIKPYTHVITPKQSSSNCWFNTMFVMFFISDKGRKFFQYFRSMMIKGTKLRSHIINGREEFYEEKIPEDLHRSFFLLNMAIEASLSGNEYSYSLDTNDIITKIYQSITTYNKTYQTPTKIPNKNQFGHPIYYYDSIMQFLSDSTIMMLQYMHDPYISVEQNEMELVIAIEKMKRKPHIIAIDIDMEELVDEDIKHKETYVIDDATYQMDSILLRDFTNKTHFTCVITYNQKGYAYDGASYTTLIPFNWRRELLEKSNKYSFENKMFGNQEYSTKHSLCLLLYYRI